MNLQKMIDAAHSRKGRLLSKVYLGSKIRYWWQCHRGHKWEATAASVVNNGTWCARCAGKIITLNDAAAAARQRGGVCLSKEYQNNRTPMQWRCKLGHTWTATYNNIQRGTWCPVCASGYSERYTRELIEGLTGHKFPKVRPNWLVGPKNRKLELDGYCEELSLAFEYQGEQHYKSNFMVQSLKERRAYDALKRRICAKHGVQLIAVSYRKQIDQLKGSLIQRIGKLAPAIDINEDFEVDISKISHADFLDLLKAKIESRGGRLIENHYFNTKQKIHIQCERNHTWQTIPNYVMQGYWCPYCQGRNKTITDMAILAAQREGKVISSKYINSKTKLRWECKFGHQFLMPPSDVISGSWCPTCGIESRSEKLRTDLKKIQAFAIVRGGKLLTTTYLDNKQKIEWQCSQKHKWKANWNSVSKGHWCPICAGLARHSLEYVKKFIESKHGKLLSTEYQNNRVPIDIQCSKKHKWRIAFKKIAIGRWCPVCAGKVKDYRAGKIAVFTKEGYVLE